MVGLFLAFANYQSSSERLLFAVPIYVCRTKLVLGASAAWKNYRLPAEKGHREKLLSKLPTLLLLILMAANGFESSVSPLAIRTTSRPRKAPGFGRVLERKYLYKNIIAQSVIEERAFAEWQECLLSHRRRRNLGLVCLHSPGGICAIPDSRANKITPWLVNKNPTMASVECHHLRHDGNSDDETMPYNSCWSEWKLQPNQAGTQFQQQSQALLSFEISFLPRLSSAENLG